VCPTLLRDGACRRVGCRYAHKSSELKASPVMLKTKLCSFHFEHGGCVVGKACRFAHSELDLLEAAEAQREVLARASSAGLETSDPSSSGLALAAATPSSRTQNRRQGLRSFIGESSPLDASEALHSNSAMAHSSSAALARPLKGGLALEIPVQAEQAGSQLEEEWDTYGEAVERQPLHRQNVVDIGQQPQWQQQQQEIHGACRYRGPEGFA